MSASRRPTAPTDVKEQDPAGPSELQQRMEGRSGGDVKDVGRAGTAMHEGPPPGYVGVDLGERSRMICPSVTASVPVVQVPPPVLTARGTATREQDRGQRHERGSKGDMCVRDDRTAKQKRPTRKRDGRHARITGDGNNPSVGNNLGQHTPPATAPRRQHAARTATHGQCGAGSREMEVRRDANMQGTVVECAGSGQWRAECVE